MARLFDDASSEYLQIEQAVIGTTPLVLYARFNSDQEAAGKFILQVVDKSENNVDFSLLHRYAALGNKLVARAYNGSGDIAESTSGFTVNTWHDACAIFASSTDRRVFLDGGSKGTNSTSVTPANLDRTCIGYQGDASPSAYFSGMIAEAAIWDLSVWPGATDSDKADNFEKILPSLAKGFSPEFFSLGLIAYWPLTRGLNDRVGGYNLTASGTVVAEHPNVIYPVGALPARSQYELISGQSDINISCTGSLSSTKKIIGEIEISVSTTAVLGRTVELHGETQISISSLASLVRKRLILGSSSIIIAVTGSLNMKHLSGSSTIAITTTAYMFKFAAFPTLSTSPRMESFIDEYSEETTIIDSYASGYPLVNPQFDFDPQNFAPLLKFVSQADKETLYSFYNSHKEDIIRWLNEQNSQYYDVIFMGKPTCSLAGSKEEWNIQIPFRQIRE